MPPSEPIMRMISRDAAVVVDVHFDAAAHELGGDVGLQIGEAEHEIGLRARESCRSSRS
jgi:hypothetical protein